MFTKRIKELLTQAPIGVGPRATVDEVVGLLHAEHISCVVVHASGKPLGIVTERGLVRLLASRDDALDALPVSGIMSTPVATLPADSYVYEAFDLLTSKDIRHLVAMDDKGRMCGVLTQSDLLHQIGMEAFIQYRPVGSIMTTALAMAEEDDPLREAVAAMARHGISCLPVLRNGALVGVLSERDVAGALSRADFEGHTVGRAMSTKVATTPQDTPLHEIPRLLHQHGVRRLVVTDGEGRVRGIVTQTDIVRGLRTEYMDFMKKALREKDVKIRNTIGELAEKTVYLESILSSAVDLGIITADINFNVSYHNAAAQRLLCWDPPANEPRNIVQIHKSFGIDPARLSMALERLAAESSHSFTFRNPCGRHVQARVSGIWDCERALTGFMLMIRDVTAEIEAVDRIRQVALHDALTGLANRVLFKERFDVELARAKRSGKGLALLMVDVDRFKDINDTLGHRAGDAVLVETAARLSARQRISDIVCRFGGDEFVVVLPDIDGPKRALAIAWSIARRFDEPVAHEGRTIPVRLSIGAALFPGHGQTPEELLTHADGAMYEAKRQGRDNGTCNVALACAPQDGASRPGPEADPAPGP